MCGDGWGDVPRLINRYDQSIDDKGRLVLPSSVVVYDNAFLPETISLGEGSVWVTTNRGAIAKIDPRSLRLVRIVRLGPAALDAVAAGRGAAWAAVELDGVARLDPSTYRVTAKVKIQKGSRVLSVSQTLLGGGKVLAIGNWTESHTATSTNAFARINTSSLRVEGVTLLPGPRLALTFGDGSLWAARAGGTVVERIDPATGRVAARVQGGAVGVDLAVAGGYLWTASATGVVSRVASVR